MPPRRESSDARRPLLAVDESGSGDALVLIHGLATTRAIWRPVIPALARRRRVVSLDVPGFGESAPAGRGFKLEAVAERIGRSLAARGVHGPFDLVGHSLGAAVALTLAAVRPRSVRTLVLVAPGGLTRLPVPGVGLLATAIGPLLAARRSLAPLSDVRLARRLLLVFAAADGGTLSPSQVRSMLAASAGATRSAAALATILGADLRPVLEEIPMPVGAIWGTRDRTVPPGIARVIQQVRPGAPVAMIEDAGHVVMVERPDSFVAELERLLSRLCEQSTSRALDQVTNP